MLEMELIIASFTWTIAICPLANTSFHTIHFVSIYVFKTDLSPVV